MEVTYTCPSCGAAMEFDAESGKMHCSFCGLYVEAEEYDEKYGKESREQQEQSKEYENTMVYHCKSCGAELIADEHTSAAICAFCGNPTLVGERLCGEFEPDTIVPFKFNKEKAKEFVKKWMSKGILTPSGLKKDSVIDEITGVYVPFWLYDYDCDDNMLANATRSRTTRDSKYVYHHTDHYSVTRSTKAEFTRIPADASTRMPDDIMDKLEPFEYNSMVPFSMPFLSGFLSEKFNYTAQEMQYRTQERARLYIEQLTRETIVGYNTVTVLKSDADCRKTKEEYSLLPVWILNYRYKNSNYKLFMNGQTGKIVANRPISTIKTIIAGVVSFAATFAVLLMLDF